MSFWGNTFIFNDVPCDDYELMLYNIGNNSQDSGNFASGVSIIEENVPTKYKPYFYGVQFNKKLEFTMVFGVNQRRIDLDKYLDRYELEAIAFWLTGHSKYMWLEIEQEDLEYVRYHCMISNLEIVEFGNIPWALKATVVCDSPYAYLYPQVFEYNISGTQTISFYNESSHNGYYMPKLEIELSGENFSIKNLSDNGRVFQFEDVPTSVGKIVVDNDRCIIENDQDLNIYPCFNFRFFRLVNGTNILEVSGTGVLRLICEFPVNVGG